MDEEQKSTNKENKISSAFPPDCDETPEELKAEVHKYFNAPDFVFEKSKIRFTLNEFDDDLLQQLDDLNKEWFPVAYGGEYFREIKEGSLTTFLAIYPVKTEKGERDFIIGGMVFKIESLDSGYISLYDNLRCFFNGFKSAHIYTLGVIKGLRGTGIASMIMTNFLDYAENGRIFGSQGGVKGGNIGLVHLDVVDYNRSAVKYYLRNGFVIFRRKQRYYQIFGEVYGGIEMVCYLNDVKRSRGFS